ncbi:MAG: 4'-phosphopantetheinyl transferase superfamily protein [Flavobacteriales bacterium]|nr:4'-phosphopantetheinyl transferase superfamily protein [Flavobacteriales bacterium]
MSRTDGRSLIIHCTARTELDRSSERPSDPPLAGEVHLWWSTLDRLRPSREKWASLLDPTESQRAERFRAERDRERFILGHGLLRIVLGHYLRLHPQDVRMARGVHGKPFVENTGLTFNFSDTKDAVLIGLTTGAEIGVDIETDHRDVDHEAVSAHYFTRPEIETIRKAGPAANRQFLQLWTRKEAVLKASGVGIMEDLRSLRVDGMRNSILINHEAFMRMAAPEYHVVSMAPDQHHWASLAMPHPPVDVRWFDAAQWTG